MDPRWQSTTHVQPAPPVPLSDVPEPLRVKWVEAVLDQVSAGHWSPLRAAEELRGVGFAASAEKVKAAMAARDRAFENPDPDDRLLYRDERDWLVSRLARPVGGLTRGAA